MQSPSAHHFAQTSPALRRSRVIFACVRTKVFGPTKLRASPRASDKRSSRRSTHCLKTRMITDLARSFLRIRFLLGALCLRERRFGPTQRYVSSSCFPCIQPFLLRLHARIRKLRARATFAYALNRTGGQSAFARAGSPRHPWLFLVYCSVWRATPKHVSSRQHRFAFPYVVAGIGILRRSPILCRAVAPAVREPQLKSFGSAIGLLMLAVRRSRPTSHSLLSFASSGGRMVALPVRWQTMPFFYSGRA